MPGVAAKHWEIVAQMANQIPMAVTAAKPE
jgi:hypothetical protein